MVREELISLALGYASIGCWLCAQMPQIVVNWRRKSVDGLALPFLVNWFIGDATNLIGCILTHQLPFQTYLATYFVFVDFCLLTQYYIYDAAKDAKALSALRSQSHTSLLPPSLAYSPYVHTLPRADLARSRSRSYSMDPHLRTAVANASLATAELEARHAEPHASDVDTRYAHARWRRSGSRRAGSLEGLPESVVADIHTGDWAGRVRPESDDGDEAVDLESESIPSNMVTSFHSEGGGHGRKRDKHVAWNTKDTMDRPLSDDQTHPESSSNARGRQLARSPVYDSPITGDEDNLSPFRRTRTTSTASSVSAAASRRSAGIVFLGVFALFGLSTRAGLGYRIRRDVQGEVLALSPETVPFSDGVAAHSLANPVPVFVSFGEYAQPHVTSEGETERLIGRVSAWACTTMYLTSRLPQIWKNFVRKSVEGLSMFLFVFAFLGNSFYVLSILTNPKMDLPPPQAAEFLRTSIPYLLGSGGTLLFDITIVMQSFVYANRIPRAMGRRRRKSVVSEPESGEEERALLAANAAD